MPKSASTLYTVCAIMKKETTIAQPGIVLKLRIQKLMLERQLVNEFLRSKSCLSMSKRQAFRQKSLNVKVKSFRAKFHAR